MFEQCPTCIVGLLDGNDKCTTCGHMRTTFIKIPSCYPIKLTADPTLPNVQELLNEEVIALKDSIQNHKELLEKKREEIKGIEKTIRVMERVLKKTEEKLGEENNDNKKKD
jgi:hypothetical protein